KRIASAFLMSPAAMGKRLGRAKHKIRHAGIPFGIPEREELPGRLDTVLDAIYAAFTAGWTDPGGTDVVRRDLTEEALFWPGSWPSCCRRPRRRWASWPSCCTQKPGGGRGATETANTCRLPSRI